MNKRQLAEFAILAVAVIFAFKTFDNIVFLLMNIMYSLRYDVGGNSVYITNNIVTIILFAGGFFLLIKKREAIADYITDKKTGDNTLVIKSNLQELLYIVFITMSIISLFSAVSGIVTYAIDVYIKDVKSGIKEDIDTQEYRDFKQNLIQMIFALVILYFAKPLSIYFTKRNTPELEFDKKDDAA